jgi:hypothetical protein
MARLDGTTTHYCTTNNKLLLSTKLPAGSTTVIAPEAVKIKIGATAASTYTQWCGLTGADRCFMNASGNNILNRFWHIDGVASGTTAISGTNLLQVTAYFSNPEYTALGVANATPLKIYQSTNNTAFPVPSDVKNSPLGSVFKWNNNGTIIINANPMNIINWQYTFISATNVHAATFNVKAIGSTMGFGKY